MSQAKAISLSQFTSAVQAAVKSAVQKHPKFHIEAPHDVTFSYLIRGIPVPDRFTVAETQAFANDIAAHLNASHPEGLAGTGAHGVVFSASGHVVIGIPALETFHLQK